MFRKLRQYKISVNEDWASPEETLLDSGSDYRDMETPIPNYVFKTVFYVIAVLCVAVMSFVFNLSVRRHDYFAGISFQNKSVNFPVSPPRGIIFDRLGKPLVSNNPIFELLVISKEVKDSNSQEDISEIAGILGKDRSNFEKFLADSSKSNASFIAASDLDKNQVLGIKILNPKGFYIVPNTKRVYIDGPQFSQVLGHVGKVSKNDLAGDDYYRPSDFVGRLGVEAQYEQNLRGEHGEIFFQYDDKNLSKDPVIGNSVVLNIDYDMQKRLFNEIFNVLRDTKYSRAAAIVQNPQTGSVLAMTSFPAFDNNLFVDGLTDSQFKGLFENKSRPLFNRVISGLYNPGSTIKPLMGLMALEEKIFSPSTTIKDCVGLTVVNPYNPDDIYTFKNWRSEYGLFDLKRAIANSCNVYFFIAGGGYGNIKGLGVEKIADYLKSSFADARLGIDLPGEEKGFVPTPDWKLAARGENWYQGDTYNISIGQGDLLITPLWLNSYISAIANGGTLHKPLVAKQILDNSKNVIEDFKPQILEHLAFKEENLKEIKNAMLETTVSGTARVLGTLPVKIGAKTGTAEVIKGRAVNSILVAFGPFDNPEINVTILIEGSATNEGLAIRAAYGFMRWYFEEYNNQRLPF